MILSSVREILKKYLATILFLLFCTLILALSVRGIPGNPTKDSINNLGWKDNGPFELSPERGRFALTFSIIEDKSVYFSVPIARFTLPDLGYKNGHYVSLFPPGVSFIAIPGYLIGKLFGIGQVGAFATIAFFALLNAFLIRKIALGLKADPLAASLGAIVFLFATPAFPYAVTLYQHHISTFLILLSIYAVLRWKSLWSLGLVLFLSAVSIPIDYPNLFLMAPVGILALGKMIDVKRVHLVITANIKPAGLLMFLTILLPLAFLFWFNQQSYNNPLQFSGTISSVKGIDQKGQPVSPQELAKQAEQGPIYSPQELTRKKVAVQFFNPRRLLNGFYIHFISLDRGVLWYTPVIFFGLLGAIYLFKKNEKVLALFLAIIGVNILLYSMWGDPWGGWAFGSRYLIPTYATAAILIAIALNSLKKNIFFLIFFFLVLGYSSIINTLGAITSSKNPPQVEILNLEQLSGHEEKYTYARNYDYLLSNGSKSYFWQAWGKNYLSGLQYLELLSFLIISASGSMIVTLWIKGKNV